MPPCHGGGRGFEPRPVRKTSAYAEVFAFMAFYVYIPKSLQDGTFYKGSYSRPFKRFDEHNEGKCRYTKTKKPWELVYVEKLTIKKEMLVWELKLKRWNKEYFENLIGGPSNIVKQFFGEE